MRCLESRSLYCGTDGLWHQDEDGQWQPDNGDHDGQGGTWNDGTGWDPGTQVTVNGGGGTSSVLDQRANALAAAVNRTGVRAMNNPCTIAGWYAASATAAVSTADIAGAGEIGDAGTAVRTAAKAALDNPVVQKAAWYAGMLGVAAVVTNNVKSALSSAMGAAKAACDAMQE